MPGNKLADGYYETDFLVVGGGDAGCSAAIKAAELGVDVLMLEKAKTDRSGHSGMGMDHVMDFPRDGVSYLDYVKYFFGRHELLAGPGLVMNPNVGYVLGERAWWALGELEKWGMPMRWDDGDYHWVRNGWFGVKTMIGVHWLDIKPALAKKARQSGVKILERTMLVDLLTDNGRIAGATAVNTRTGEFIVIKAKTVLLCTGNLARNYSPETPQFYRYKFRYHGAPGAISGDGYAAAYKIGAELANMDIGTSWNYRIRDDITFPFGCIDHGDGIRGQWMNYRGEPIPFPTAGIYDEIEKRGLDPIYCTIEHFPDDYHKRNEISIADERFISLKFGEDRGFDPKKHRYELMENRKFGFYSLAGFYTDESFETSVKGLFAAGDSVCGLGGCGAAVISGMIVGNGMPDYLKSVENPVLDETQIEKSRTEALKPLSVKDGTEPMELECAVRYINDRYVGMHMNEGKLLEGLKRLNSLKRVFLPELMAENPHYLMRCIEARNILEMSEVHLNACLFRKETRGNFVRIDYPERDPKNDNCILIQRMENGKHVIEMRRAPELKAEYIEEGKKHAANQN